MSTVVQPCARCGARWAVQATPLHWCPRCHGVLLSPAPIDAPAERRNYRWVARRPDQRGRRTHGGRQTAATPTPRYAQVPRWGLLDPPPAPAVGLPPNPLGAFVRWTTRLLIATAGIFTLAAVGELLRYAILLYNRTRLVHPAVLWVSDALVVVSSMLALVLALLTAVAALGWLIEMRRAAYRRQGRTDPRPVWSLTLGCVIPVVNLLWPGVFLTEAVADREDPRVLRVIRLWWLGWVFGGAIATAALLWKLADSLQAKADGVAFTAFADLVAAALAVLTLWMMRAVEGRDLFGRSRIARRWVIAVDPAVPVIEPVQPGAGVAAPRIAADTDAQDREHEEVVAK
ncbi:DUF4328 domain-containing protein [Nocardia sp. NPDC052566]|uniref:DUF4328 domain-containing protein n=1 Tax=Nocardia sp. NPDC052566 TaxID=3364330 RepID=UPI0037C92970